MRLRLHRASCALVFAVLAVFQASPLWAAERSALIQYIFLIPHSDAQFLCSASSFQPSKPVQVSELPAMFVGAPSGSSASIFQRLDERCSFVLLTEPKFDGSTKLDGYRRSLTVPSDIDHSESFSMPSQFLIGSPALGATKSSVLSFQHVDVGPGFAGPMPASFDSLYRRLSMLKGFQGFQVWTWNSRPNHWTVITSWKDQDSAFSAQSNPDVMAIWNILYRDTAAPKNKSFYRLIQVR
jgi:hypothetical protein